METVIVAEAGSLTAGDRALVPAVGSGLPQWVTVLEVVKPRSMGMHEVIRPGGQLNLRVHPVTDPTMVYLWGPSADEYVRIIRKPAKIVA